VFDLIKCHLSKFQDLVRTPNSTSLLAPLTAMLIRKSGALGRKVLKILRVSKNKVPEIFDLLEVTRG